MTQIYLSIQAFLFNSITKGGSQQQKQDGRCEMGIRNNAGWLKRFKDFYPELGLAAEILGVLMMMLICCVEF